MICAYFIMLSIEFVVWRRRMYMRRRREREDLEKNEEYKTNILLYFIIVIY